MDQESGSILNQAVEYDASAAFKTGERIDHYEIIRRLGQGGMADVYLARDTVLGRRVALKFVATERAQIEPTDPTFEREARAIAMLNHPNIVHIYGYGFHAGQPYISLEYVEGESLRDRMLKDPPSVREAQRLILAIVSALKEAHASSIIHGDLKPENVVISRDGRLRVLDFGLARVLNNRDEVVTMSPGAGARTPSSIENEETVAALSGTPTYMAPEIWAQQHATPAIDLWALGIMMFELLTRRLPYEDSSFADMSFLHGLLSSTPMPLVENKMQLPERLAAVVNSCLRKDPLERATAAQVLETLEQLVHGDLTVDRDGDSPFRGLDAFTEAHSQFFFGRDEEISAFMEAARTETILPIVGASGVGKSSFIQAGVIPRLRERGEWSVIRVRPGSEPFRALASRLVDRATTTYRSGVDQTVGELQHIDSLAQEFYDQPKKLALQLLAQAKREGSRLLLLVDQLEEVCTLVNDHETRRRFLQAICNAADDPSEPVRVVFTVRDDFLTRLADSPDASRVLRRVTVLRAPADEALREILTRPPALLGYEYDDPKLVDEMVAAVADEPSALPLLEFAGSMLWEKRDRSTRKLLRSAYDRMGGVQGALATHADGFMRDLSEAQTATVRGAMLRLVTPEGTRRVTPRNDLIEALGKDSEMVLLRLTEARLLSVRESLSIVSLELSHESLVHTWDRLARWREEGREELAFVAELEQAAALWEKRGERRSEAWTGQALQEMQRNLDRFGSKVTDRARRFIRTSQSAEHRRRRLRLALSVSLVALLLLLSVASLITAVSFAEKKAIAEQQRAQAQAEGARSAYQRGDLVAAAAQVRGSLQTSDSNLARAVWDRLSRSKQVWQHTLPSNNYGVAFAHDGEQIAIANMDYSIYLLDRQTARERVLRDLSQQVKSVGFSRDARYVAAGTTGGLLGVWDQSQQSHFQQWEAATVGIGRVGFAPNSDEVFVAGWNGVLSVWDPKRGKVREASLGQGYINDFSFSSDGTWLMTAHQDGRVRVVDAKSLTVRQEFVAYAKDAVAVAFNDDDTVAAIGGGEGQLSLLSLKTGVWAERSQPFSTAITGLEFLDPNRLIASAYEEALLEIEVPTLSVRKRHAGHTSAVSGLDRTENGEIVTVGFSDRSVRVWNFSRKESDTSERGHRAQGLRVRFSPDGKKVASGAEDKTIRVWDVATGEQQQVLVGHTDSVNALAFSPDGKSLASGSFDNTIRLFDLATGTNSLTLRGHQLGVYDVVFTNDGKNLVSASWDQTVRVWSVREGQLLRTHRVDGKITALALAKAGSLVATSYDAHYFFNDLNALPIRRPFAGWGADIAADASSYLLTPLNAAPLLMDRQGKMLEQWPARAQATAYWGHLDPLARRVAVPYDDGLIFVYPRGGGRELVVRGHVGVVAEAVFAPAGDMIASTGDDGTVRVFDSHDGRSLWFSVGLLSADAALSHRGWQALSTKPGTTDSALRQHLAADARLFSSSPSHVCVEWKNGELDLLTRPEGASLSKQAVVGRLKGLLTVGDGCVAWVGDDVWYWNASQARRALTPSGAGKLNSVSVSDRLVVLVEEDTVQVLDPARPESSRRIDSGKFVTAALPMSDGTMLGYRNGSLEYVDRSGQRSPLTLERQPSGPVMVMKQGPKGAIVLGYANGTVATYGAKDGAELARTKLHGAVVSLVVDGPWVAAQTDLGDSGLLDVSAFTAEHCDIVRAVWKEVHIEWNEGLPERRPLPEQHPCMANVSSF